MGLGEIIPVRRDTGVVARESFPDPERLAQGPLPAITGFPPDLARLPGGCSFAPRCPVGRELERCHEQAPSQHRVNGPAGAASVECHFAEERIGAAREVRA